MRFSLRQRLITLTVLGTIAFVAALLTIVRLARTGHQQRIERAHEAVENEVERLRTSEAAPLWQQHPRRLARPGPPMRSGYLDATMQALGPDRSPWPFVADALATMRAAADASEAPTVREIDAREGTVVLAIARRPTGGYAWAAARVLPQAAWQAWRIGLLVLSLATLALVLATMHTLFALRRGAHALRADLTALEKDLNAGITRPSIRELGDVADGIAHLARELAHAQSEHERLTRELAERERLASLGRVAAGVAHEVRNPLASMKLRVDLAERVAGVPDSVARDLAEVSGEIQRLDRLVTDLLAITGRRLGKRESSELAALVAKRVALLAPWAGEMGITFAVNGAAEADIDRDAVGRALDNLLRNAAQASPRGATVSVTLDMHDAEARVTVIDRGPGVSPEHTTQLFEPFFTTRSEGTGLGLALSRSIAAAHGGTLVYERTGGETRFVLSLPSHAPSREHV